jgi:hypothetical protein
MAASFIGLTLVAVNLLVFYCLCRFWKKPRSRLGFIILLAIGLLSECAIVRWLGGPGIHQLSRDFSNTIHLPPAQVNAFVGLLSLFAVASLSWRLATRLPETFAGHCLESGKPMFHESWLGALLLAAVAMWQVIYFVVSSINASQNFMGLGFNMEMLLYGLTFYPEQFLWLAAAIGGLAMAWSRWPNRKKPFEFIIPNIEPGLFGVAVVGQSIMLLAGAAILAAASFSSLFLIFEIWRRN